MNREKVISLAKKLKALADRGIDGERESAKEKLDALLKEHGLELYQISDGLRTFERTTLNEGSVILERIIKSVNPSAQISVKQFKTKLLIEVVLTDIEHKEVRQKYKFFWRAYNRERKLLLTSFFNKHYSEFSSSRAGRNNRQNNPMTDASDNAPQKSAESVALQKSTQKPESNSSGQHGSDGFRGRPLSPLEEEKVRAYMKILDKLDYARISEMQDSESAGDMEYSQNN